MPHDKLFCDEMADVDAISSAVPPRTSCDAMGLPDWVYAPAKKVNQAKPALLSVDTLITVDDVASYLRVSTKTVRRQIAAGHISAIRIGRSIRVSPDELVRLFSDKYSRIINRKKQYRE